MTGLRHKIQTPVVNGVHLYECQRCGRRWPASSVLTERQWLSNRDADTNIRDTPDASNCPGRPPDN